MAKINCVQICLYRDRFISKKKIWQYQINYIVSTLFDGLIKI